MYRIRLTLAAAVLAGWTCVGLAAEPAAGPRTDDPEALLDEFRTAWDQAAWVPEQSNRPGYLRPAGDRGWKQRIRTIQALVRNREHALAPLKRALDSPAASVRALAAQTLGFCGDERVCEELARLAEHDPDAAVRLYAADSLGMLGADRYGELLEKLESQEQNRDAKRHIRYAIERSGAPIQPEHVDRLVEWDAQQVDSAVVGEPAPDFELASLDGRRVRLSDYRGEKAVALVFVYGDT